VGFVGCGSACSGFPWDGNRDATLKLYSSVFVGISQGITEIELIKTHFLMG